MFPVVTLGEHYPEIDHYFGIACLGVHGDGGFSEYFVTNENQIVLIPEELGLDKAALADPLSVSSEGIKEGNIKERDVVAIFGYGPIRLFAIPAAKAAGAKEIFAFDLRDGRLRSWSYLYVKYKRK